MTLFKQTSTLLEIQLQLYNHLCLFVHMYNCLFVRKTPETAKNPLSFIHFATFKLCSLYNVKSISAMSQNMLTHIWLVLCKAELKKTVENHL